MKKLRPGLHQLTVGVSHAFLLRQGDELVLIDAGPEDDVSHLLDEVRAAGVGLSAIDHVVVTHAHQDHAGGLRRVKEATNATVWMHPEDAVLVEAGRARRAWTVTPGLFHRVLYWLYVRGVPDTVPAVEIDRTVRDGDVIPVAGGLDVVHVPGHCTGQIALLWQQHGGVLFAADAALSLLGRPRLSVVYEDLEQGRDDLRRLATLDVDTAVFGHGAPIMTDAAERFREQFGNDSL